MVKLPGLFPVQPATSRYTHCIIYNSVLDKFIHLFNCSAILPKGKIFVLSQE